MRWKCALSCETHFPHLTVKTNALAFFLFALALAGTHAAPVEIIPPELRGAVQPQVAVSPNGRVHVVFGKDNAVYYTGSADGRVFSAPGKIGELDKLALRKRHGRRITAT